MDCGYDDYPTIENSLFGAVKFVKNAYIDKFKYSVYGIGFDRHGTFSIGNGFGKNVITFGANMSSFVHVDNNKKDGIKMEQIVIYLLMVYLLIVLIHSKEIYYIFPKKSFLIFWEIKRSSPKLKTLLYFFKKNFFVSFGKRNFLATNLKNSYFFQQKVFLVFLEMEFSSLKIKNFYGGTFKLKK